MAVGAGSSIATGYVLEMTIGDGHYSRRDLAIDGTLGAVGVGSIKNIGKGAILGAKYARRARYASQTDDVVDVTRYGVKITTITADEAVLISRAGYGSSLYHALVFGVFEVLKGFGWFHAIPDQISINSEQVSSKSDSC